MISKLLKICLWNYLIRTPPPSVQFKFHSDIRVIMDSSAIISRSFGTANTHSSLPQRYTRTEYILIMGEEVWMLLVERWWWQPPPRVACTDNIIIIITIGQVSRVQHHHRRHFPSGLRLVICRRITITVVFTAKANEGTQLWLRCS